MGICSKACRVKVADADESTPLSARMVVTSTSPVSAQMMTVSQKTEVLDTNA